MRELNGIRGLEGIIYFFNKKKKRAKVGGTVTDEAQFVGGGFVFYGSCLGDLR